MSEEICAKLLTVPEFFKYLAKEKALTKWQALFEQAELTAP